MGSEKGTHNEKNMKLSQKLLALSGVALADYACCPYDDYGIPDADCNISEKTPFSADETWNGNSCKAWEGNVDASFDGNDNNCASGEEDWSSCGFQRHFSWISANNALENQVTSSFFLDLTGNNDGAFGSAVPLAMNPSTSQSDGYSVGGSPFLQGVCKLFIPVTRGNIASVSIAGVHISGNGDAAYDANVSDNAVSGSRNYQIDGTAYCFSVVNPSEFLSNFNGNDLYLNNGNVAGFRSLTAEGQAANLANDPFDALTQTERQAGVENPLYGSPLFADQKTYESLLGNDDDASNIVKKGANFDVVAHFNHDFCTGFWTPEEMQMPGDWGNNDGGSVDYPDGVVGDITHVHTDTTDKRFVNPAATLGDMHDWNSRYTVSGSTMTSPSSAEVRWPNAGAYAGYYSFVACANPDTSDYGHTNYSKFIYIAGDDTVSEASCTGVIPAVPADTRACLESALGINQIVSSLGNSMWRYECENELDASNVATDNFTPEMRFNLRQAGSNIRNCGPGTMPDTDNARCSWNWNFKGYQEGSPAANVANQDPESYFMRSNPKAYAVWGADAENNNVAAWGEPSSMTQSKDISVTINNRAGTIGGINVGDPSLTAVANDVPAVYINGGAGSISGNTYSFTLKCNVEGGTVRDVFPDCYQGEEIHLSAEVTYPENYSGDWIDVMADPWLTEATIA